MRNSNRALYIENLRKEKRGKNMTKRTSSIIVTMCIIICSICGCGVQSEPQIVVNCNCYNCEQETRKTSSSTVDTRNDINDIIEETTTEPNDITYETTSKPSTTVDKTTDDVLDTPDTETTDNVLDTPDTETTAGSTTDINEEIDEWKVSFVENYIPFTPEGYEGRLVNITRPYTDRDYITNNILYDEIALFFNEEDMESYNYDKSFSFGNTDSFESGKIITNVERLLFLEHNLNGEVNRYFLDVDLDFSPDTFGSYSPVHYNYTRAINENLILIILGRYIFTYEIETNKCNVITDSAITFDCKSSNDTFTLYFKNFEYVDYECTWEGTKVSISEAENIASYNNYNFQDYVIDSEFQETFLEIQQIFKTEEGLGGELKDKLERTLLSKYNNPKIFFSKITMDDFRKDYSLHLPYAVDSEKYHSKVIDRYPYSHCLLIDNEHIILYRYGDVVRKYKLPNGNWHFLSYNYKIKDNVDITSADDLDKAISELNVLLFDTSTNVIYRMYEDGTLKSIAQDILDFSYSGELLWIDTNNRGYVIKDWKKSDEPIFLGDDIIRIKYAEGYLGLVKPGDPRIDLIYNGYPMFRFQY